ncbi:MAG: hypothetical protein B6242_01325 [Anaerolineaceae bacterium 4572_78]|nr:MAG: hypothetical protein B6242_01325 [Anaerolineaceae bacterium 4572_78]
MTFLNPVSFFLLALIPPIIALYLLKLRRREHYVSSTYLWRRFVRDVEANAPWQRLKRNLLLLLQIIFMLILIFALSRPVTETVSIASQMIVIVLDTSASMTAIESRGILPNAIESKGVWPNAPTTRLDMAKKMAGSLITNLPYDAQVTVITASGGHVDLLVSASRDRHQTLALLDSVQGTPFNSDLIPALTLAEAITAREPYSEIVLLSDGVIQLPAHPPPMRFIPVGKQGSNQQISALSATMLENGQAMLLVQIRNFDAQPVQRRLTVNVDGNLFHAVDMELPPNGFHAVGNNHNSLLIPVHAKIVTVQLMPNQVDMFPVDDNAWLVIRPTETVNIALVPQGNFFLRTALNLLDVSFEQMETTSENKATLHIFDSYIPDELPTGNILFIAPPASIPSLFEVTGQVLNPSSTDFIADSPLLAHVNLRNIRILTTTKISGANWAKTIIGYYDEDEVIPLLLAGEIEGQRMAIVAFDLNNSDLPLRPAFPILMANLINYLSPTGANIMPSELMINSAHTFSVSPDITTLNLVLPDGQNTSFAVEAGSATLSQLDQLGIYQLEFETTGFGKKSLNPVNFAVNFFDPVESNLTPKPDLPFIKRDIIETSTVTLPPAYHEWWRPLAMMALGLLVLEWLVYQRNRILRWIELIKVRI